MMVDDIAAYLVAQSTLFSLLSGTTGNLTKTFMPSTGAPDTLTTLFETPGSGTVFEFSTSTSPSRVLTQPSLQALSRSTSAQTAQTHSETIWGLLDGLSGAALSGTTYVQITADQSPFQADRDANQRHIWSVNFTVWKTT